MMLNYEAAVDRVLDLVVQGTPVRQPLDAAYGLVLAEAVVAQEALPPFDNSAMDGYAVRSQDLMSSSADHPVSLRILAEQAAGTDCGQQLHPGETIRIMTGAPIPLGADAVVPVEDAEADGEWLRVARRPVPGAHVRPVGEDVKAGALVLEAGARLGPAELALLGAVGRAEVEVVPAPKVAVITTGDELVDVAEPLGPARIRDANIHALCAQVRECGAIPVPIPRVPDSPDALEAALRKALATADVICTNGGVSMGTKDHVRPVLERMGAEACFWQVAQKPGRPMAFSLLEGRPVFGIPGNPVAAQICFELYVKPALMKMMGRKPPPRQVIRAVLKEHAGKAHSDTRTHFLRVRLEEEGGQVMAWLTGPQGSGLLASMTRTHGLLVLPAEGRGFVQGEEVDIHLLGGVR